MIVLFINCREKEKHQPAEKFTVSYSAKAFLDVYKENDSIINTFKKFVNSEYEDFNLYWKKSDTTIFKYAYDDLYFLIPKNYPSYIPTILAIQKINKNKYVVKIGIMGSPEEIDTLVAIYNFYAIRENNGDFKFENVISQNLKMWNKFKIENIEYYYPANKELNQAEVNKQIEFENSLISKFNFKKINYKYISANTTYDFMKLRGFDYDDTMFFNNQKGGQAFSNSNLIFSGNNSEYYAHELVHLYVHKYFSEANSTINEGLATYLGDSLEMDYKTHIRILKIYIKTNNINLFEYLFDDEKKYTIIGDGSSIRYSAGALLCAIADKKNVLEALLDSGKSDEELIKTIEIIFNIKRIDFNSFILKELEQY